MTDRIDDNPNEFIMTIDGEPFGTKQDDDRVYNHSSPVITDSKGYKVLGDLPFPLGYGEILADIGDSYSEFKTAYKKAENIHSVQSSDALITDFHTQLGGLTDY